MSLDFDTLSIKVSPAKVNLYTKSKGKARILKFLEIQEPYMPGEQIFQRAPQSYGSCYRI